MSDQCAARGRGRRPLALAARAVIDTESWTGGGVGAFSQWRAASLRLRRLLGDCCALSHDSDLARDISPRQCLPTAVCIEHVRIDHVYAWSHGHLRALNAMNMDHLLLNTNVTSKFCSVSRLPLVHNVLCGLNRKLSENCVRLADWTYSFAQILGRINS